jgi:hypothetical protein
MLVFKFDVRWAIYVNRLGEYRRQYKLAQLCLSHVRTGLVPAGTIRPIVPRSSAPLEA